jgi:hypothetical protein
LHHGDRWIRLLPANLHGDDLYLVPLQDEKMMGDQRMKKGDLSLDEKMMGVLSMDAKKMRRDGWMDAMSYRVPNLRDAVDHPFSFSSI